ncbi:Ser-Thr-rich glycosyl-phosphatidyl-inositol-anchored membrane family-domain-containing protein [Lasiosphaeria miniovina]|uniref:Ser-Thr-rich glycosyl-phosphatidyl-inositol-anchored membrane family-domain-containing protein n=2 Tax=Lasiosphaeria TaxID=92901 RepID=A0AA40EAT4_9PEZI|nr:Ser-Thr-rich glycosyl-phosphatidyl-inositol-anchored membrane family-domain-containing protein [Lasiosphaeria miniovina]KAK0734734.1 Ser-Thr-rich glycosyl-phosphatidyl-inositol-anchored membrane family-domain-containing protein [Lasiosphaeria miniovina]KAK3382573.1 Ser-Thr-rich glycosyl-phosphatidyl-inositol-anchored membrane family-domain-containing protein [Lasiosphaeria ovina]
MRFLSLFALAAPLVAAIEFTAPAANSTVSKGAKFDLSWSTVDTDPGTFSVYLVNFFNWPPLYVPLVLDVETTAGEIEVTVPCDVDSSWGYQFNAINGTNTYVIYAQTPKFFIGGGPCTSPTLDTPPTCAAAATVTVTVSTTLSANSTGKPTTLAPVSSKTTAAPSPGKCPDTIGWGESGYSHPVTLTRVPHASNDVPTTTPAPGAWTSKDAEASTSTLYTTIYKDLSEVNGCAC